jgi:hypothetical protein
VYACGAGSHGAHGLGDVGAVPEPRRVTAGLVDPVTGKPAVVRALAASSHYSFFADTRGNAFVCGARRPGDVPPAEGTVSVHQAGRRASQAALDAAALAAGASGATPEPAKPDEGTEVLWAPTRLSGIEPLGNVPLGQVAKFTDARAPVETTARGAELARHRNLDECVVVLDAACVPFHPHQRTISDSRTSSSPHGFGGTASSGASGGNAAGPAPLMPVSGGLPRSASGKTLPVARPVASRPG